MLPSLIVLDQMHFNMQQLLNYKSSWATKNILIGSKCESMITTYSTCITCHLGSGVFTSGTGTLESSLVIVLLAVDIVI